MSDSPVNGGISLLPIPYHGNKTNHFPNKARRVSAEDMAAYQNWISQFLDWHMNRPYGKAKMIYPNNHSRYFNLQLGLYASFTEMDSILHFCRTNFRETLLPNQMAADGSFPLELQRTKPHFSDVFEVRRTQTIKSPLIWMRME
ncbi:MAG: alginate lyase family protein [Bacteroidota bacterium]